MQDPAIRQVMYLSALNNEGPSPNYLPIKVEDCRNHCAAIIVLAKPAAGRTQSQLGCLWLTASVAYLVGAQWRQNR